MKKLMMGVVAAMAMGVMAEAVNTVTQTTPVPVPYAWLDAHVPGVAQESEAYEAAASEPAANGRPVWACYAVGLDPSDPLNDFRISSFPMEADGTPDLASVAFDPPREQWNVPDAPVTWKGAAKLEGPWRMVPVTLKVPREFLVRISMLFGNSTAMLRSART